MIYDLAIIGGGPAGITAGIYGARKKLKILFLTKDFTGQATKTSEVDNWPGAPRIQGLQLIKTFKEHLDKFVKTEQGIELKEGEKVKAINKQGEVFLVETEAGRILQSKTIIIATGQRSRQLAVPGEAELQGRGVSYCSTCDAPFFKDKKVLVAGGGNAGLETALDLASYAGAVFILERNVKLLADEVLQDRIKREKKIKVLLNKEIKKIIGKQKVEGILYQDLESRKSEILPIDGVFVAIGSAPNSEFVSGFLDLNNKGEIKINLKTMASSIEGVFACGDVREGRHKQIVLAAADGCLAALSAYHYLQNL